MSVIPRPASTVVLMDELSRVYMTRRPKTMKFLSGFYVFPGGSVEEDDFLLADNLLSHWQPTTNFCPSHYIAAARELYEEVGVLLGHQQGRETIQLEKKNSEEYRRLLIAGKISFSQLLKQERIELNLDKLSYFGHRITPKDRPHRFDVRFFIAELPAGQIPIPDENEIDEAFWINPAEAIQLFQKGELSMVPPTILSLQTIINYQNGGELRMLN
ncbi:NUDIX hydrolase [Bacillus sp. EB600]|uniref:NUDIX hydrolase n=1 Tax=Bacillus sp. EB600 TaxID=2806345 RepID=UPI00210C3681|nr:NUDIX hydrolase [Bacillus sp. EB600]MCQ6279596.1 NUDIX hydrolase [Bacillus sp. EB600]